MKGISSRKGPFCLSSAERVLVSAPWPRVRRLTLNRPDKRNAFDNDMLAALLRRLEEAEADPEVGAIVLTGAGSTFCAGADIHDFRKSLGRPVPDLYDDGRLLVRLFQLVEAYEKPLIAQVNGPALGGGVGFVAMCHFAVAAAGARLGATELRIGLWPMVIWPALVRSVGEKRALQMALTADIYSAEEARAFGLVDEVVAEGELDEATGELARKVAGWSPAAVGLGLRSAAMVRDMPVDKALEALNSLRQVLQQTEDLHEGTTAFFEKRAPRWRGR